MRAVVQRVTQAEVRVGSQSVAQMGAGLLVLLAVHEKDTLDDLEYLAGKLSRLRIFDDDAGRMNLDIRAVNGTFLVVSQFTLYGDCRRGNRPSFVQSAKPGKAEHLYDAFVQALMGLGHDVLTGQFREMMQVELVNDGPVTLVIDTQDR